MSARVADIAAAPAFAAVRKCIVETAGLAYYADKEALLVERLESRMRTLGCSQSEYFGRVLGDGREEELAALIDEATVNETYFFRSPRQFDALRDVILPDCVRRRGGQGPVRIWSAGCASGAEPYSVSILMTELYPHAAAYSVLGTDISRRALALAEAALFSPWELRGVPAGLRARCFVESKRGLKLRPAFRAHVRFEHQNLVSDIADFARKNAGAFDVILCRNVMIYFTPEVMRRLLQGFRDCLADGGWFLAGHAEPYFEIANYFRALPDFGPAIYRHRDECEPAPPPAPLMLPASPPRPVMAAPVAFEPPVPAPPAEPGIAEQVRRLAARGEWDRALALCAETAAGHPLDPALHYVHALLLGQAGSAAEEEAALRRAIYLDRAFVLAHYRLGCLKLRAGLRAEARRAMTNALRLLAHAADAEPLAMGEGLTAGDLKALIATHLSTENRH